MHTLRRHGWSDTAPAPHPLSPNGLWGVCWGWPWATRSALHWKDGQHPRLQFCTRLAFANCLRAMTSSKGRARIRMYARARMEQGLGVLGI